MKKFILLLVLFLGFHSAWAHIVEVDGIYYYLNSEDKTASVTDWWGSYYSGEIVIPETVIFRDTSYSVTSLGESCFRGCSSLTSITIPNSVTSLGDDCFEGCSSLTSIYMIPSTPPITGDGIFDDTPLETVYVVDVNAKRVYLAQEPWNQYAIVVMPTGIEELETDKITPTIVGYYDLSGRPINGKQRGAVILRYSDGSSRKVMVK